MTLHLVCGLVIGLLLPYIARRFAKFMPATPAYAFWQVIFGGKHSKRYYKTKLFKQYLWHSIISGLVSCGLSYVFAIHFSFNNLWWHLSFLWIVLLLAEIDWRMYLLPDILTIPLLILGFFVAALGIGWVIPAESAMGALCGYFIPVIIAIFMFKRSKNAFGGGDIKFLAALGAWIGVVPLLYVVALASIVMLIYMMIKRKSSVAFGPALSFATILIVICIF